MYEQVLIPLALDERDLTLIEAGHALVARRAVRRVCLVHVSERARPQPGRTSPAVLRPQAFEVAVEAFASRVRGVEVVGMHLQGRAVDEVVRVYAREGIDLLLVGRDRAERPGAAWGDHGLRLLRLTDGPVLVVPDGAALSFGEAVVGVDFSELAMEALARATEVFDRVRAVAVVDREGEGLDEVAFAEQRAVMKAHYEAAARVAALGGRSAPPLEVMEAGSPADALLVASMGAGVMVVGSRGLTPLAAVLLGSTAERLGGRCERPLLVHRRKGAQQGVFQTLFRGA